MEKGIAVTPESLVAQAECDVRELSPTRFGNQMMFLVWLGHHEEVAEHLLAATDDQLLTTAAYEAFEITRRFMFETLDFKPIHKQLVRYGFPPSPICSLYKCFVLHPNASGLPLTLPPPKVFAHDDSGSSVVIVNNTGLFNDEMVGYYGELISRLFENAETVPDSDLCRACLRLAERRYEEARELLRAGLVLRPRNQQVQAMYLCTLRKLGDLDLLASESLRFAKISTARVRAAYRATEDRRAVGLPPYRPSNKLIPPRDYWHCITRMSKVGARYMGAVRKRKIAFEPQ